MPDLPKGRRPVANDERFERAETLEIATVRRDVAVADTVAAAATGESHPAVVDPSPVSFDLGNRYAVRRVLGVGGMGEVRLCKDAWVGREVAMKVMRPGIGSRSAARARFLREARVQGQLEHPSVVPVYDLGRLGEGDDFFTMKRVNGLTLEEIIAGLRSGDAETVNAFSRRKLLSAMSQVCQSVAYAHRRGVVHRDLKPANVMLGTFGEVYVLDWGVAKVQGVAELELENTVSGDAAESVQTEAGALIGTPGYMSPEQARGETQVNAASDVYSLGAILFELLALQPFHRGNTVSALISSTVYSVPVAPSQEAPDAGIAPELDVMCVRALALDAIDRFPTAWELHEAIERYLDGERDAERRRELATEHLNLARAALERAALGGPNADADRKHGMRELSRALALDPGDQAALRMITELVLADTELPADAEAELKAVELRDRAVSGKRNSRVYLTWALGVPAMLWMGIKSWPLFIALMATIAAVSIGLRWLSATGRVTPRWYRSVVVGNAVMVAVATTLFGPLVFAPTLAALMAASYVVGVRANVQTRIFAISMGVIAVLGPYLAQRIGLLPPAYAFEDGLIKILPVLTQFEPFPTECFWVGATLIQLTVPALVIGKAVDALKQAERKNFAQAWRLRQLLPGDGLDGSIAPETRTVPCT